MIGQASLTRIGKYDIIGPLGAGGMGSVHLAYDSGLDREVAIKVLRGTSLDEELRARFLREARATANLHHPNIITIFEVGQHDGQPFIAMEYVAGHSLATIVAHQRPIPVVTKLTWLEQLCAGLEFAHRAGIVHRDVKPANVMVDLQDVVRILDFGIARLDGSGMTMDGALMGTINYMSPEQMLGRRVDHRSDIFAVGAVGYELISYCQAFPGTLDELLHRLPNEPPRALRALCPDLEPEVERIIAQALEKDPARRFADLSEMRSALADVRQRVRHDRGEGFVVVTPAASAALASTLRIRSSRPGRADAAEVKAQLHAASKCLDTGDAARAVEIAQRVIERAPSSIEAHALLVRAHRALAGAHERGESPTRPRARRRTMALAAGGAGLVAAALMTGSLADRESRNPPPPAASWSATRPEPPRPNPAPAPPEDGNPVPASPASAARPPAASDTAMEEAARGIMLEVERARVSAVRAKARDLAPGLFAEATAAAERARRAQSRGEYAAAARLGSSAAREFTGAAAEAEHEAERRRLADAASAATASTANVQAPPTQTIPSSIPPIAPATTVTAPAATSPAAFPPPPPENSVAAAVVNPIVRERPGIIAALDAYRRAHRARNIAALKSVYPTLSGEDLQDKERAFKDRRACRELDIQFDDPVISLTADATVAHVNVMSTYTCTPVTGQPRPRQPMPDVFQMRKAGDTWVITVMGAMGR